MDVSVNSKGSFDETEKLLRSIANKGIFSSLAKYGEEGVRALSSATPMGTGLTAMSWSYEIIQDRNSYSIVWSNSNMAGDTPVAILIQQGHGTRNGGYVQGRDFINPAIQPIFDRMAAEVWKAVTSR